jgi:hypothetical protein
MKSRELADAVAKAAAKQLAAEIEYLAGVHLQASVLRMLPEPSAAERDIVKRIQGILSDTRLIPFLSILEQHSRRERWEPGRLNPSKTRFLLGPHLRQVLLSVQARTELRQKLPVLGRPAAEVRKHLQKVSTGCKDLAELIREGPRPHVALAGETNANEALMVFSRWTELFEAADEPERQVVDFAELLDRAASWFDARGVQISRATQNKHTGKGALRVRAAEFLLGVFKRKLTHPYHAHVATIVTIVSGIPTYADFVKKVEARRRVGDTLIRKNIKTVI